ncbi:MAG: PLP-dependent aminotransferase family protein [Telmatospirillum sp.]|nr:PLP-dependent aminotransferase family protein [Telmatospirillum sp.]
MPLPPLVPGGDVPLQRQLYLALRAAILDGRLGAGTSLPSSRTLARQLSVSRNTVIAAFEHLAAEGFVDGHRGSGTRISARSPGPLAPERRGGAEKGARGVSRRARGLAGWPGPARGDGNNRPLAPGMPDPDAFPCRDWSRLLARRWRRPQRSLLIDSPGAGYAPLREAIALHFGRSRAVSCSPDQIIVVSGSQQGLDLVARVLLDPGDQAMVEDPGYGGWKGVLCAAGVVPAPVPVDGFGFDPVLAERLWPSARMACVTPSHQFPTGATMPLARRLSLIDWAHRHDAWIVEDDYDSDFRYGAPPLAALQGLDAGRRTIYCGTFSKSMFPALRLGWLVVPDDLLDAFLAVRRLLDRAPPTLTQAAMADFMAEGLYVSHLRRMQRLYGERRAALLASAGRHLAGLADTVAGDAGTHAIAWLPDGDDDRAIADAACRRGLAPAPLGAFRLRPGRPGLLLGYSHMPADRIDPAIRLLAGIIAGSPR